MPVRWLDDAAFHLPGWTALAHLDPEGTVFHTPAFLRVYREALGSGDGAVAVVEEDGDAVAVCAFEFEGGTAAFQGGSEVTDYQGPVGVPAARERAAKELMAALAERPEWDAADLRGLPSGGAWLGALEAGARDAGLEPDVGPSDVAPLMELPGSYDQYLAALPGRQRHEIRRKERRLREAFPDVRVTDATPLSMERDLEAFFELHRASPGAKGGFLDEDMERFFRGLAEELGADGTFRLAFLEAGSRRLAAAVGFRDRDVFRLYNSAFDRDAGRVAPGMVLTAELVRSAILEGCRAFDFLSGDLGYKYRFGARRRPLERLTLRR